MQDAVYRELPAATRAAPLRSVLFRREREATWRELEELIARADQGGLRALSAAELARLPHLYRATLASLSVARSISLDQALVRYLESLIGRAYFVTYGSRAPLFAQLRDFLLHGWPSAVRRRWRALALSALITVLGVITAYVLTRHDMDYYYSFIGDMAQDRTPASSTAELRQGLYEHGTFSSFLGTFAAELFSHNARIGILVFALGFVVGLPSAFLLFYNGLVLGAFVALYTSRGLGWDVWGWLLPHGITELGAVILCGAAAFTVAGALAFPGARSRLDNLRDHGRDAARIVAGAVLMLFVAGLIEGIFRQTVTSIGVRFTVAGLTALGWGWYFARVGRAARLPAEGAADGDGAAEGAGAAGAAS
ncbi:MAG TPA: stage II sporulation protein M [Kofleriaceae bacterium]|nr:stage II sporulation protein M [Kofleriaceae bacterium]